MKSKPRFKKASTSPRSRASLVSFGCIAIFTTHHALALEEAVGHVELDPTFSVSDGTWQWPTFWFDNDLNERTDPAETLVFHGMDTSPTSFGVRNFRPAHPKWDFLGMAAGEAVWIFQDSSSSSAGFASTQLELSGNLKITLVGVDGPTGGHFSMFSGLTPDIHMQTLNGIGPDDVFSKPPQHSHVNWAFSRKGLWIVRLKAQGTLASTGALTPPSPATRIVFAIGDYARWKASNFDLAALSDPAISGDDADPDGDAWCNLMEYALGGNPRVSSAFRQNDGQALAPRLLPPATTGEPWKICYYRRISANESELSYQIESSSSLAATSWTLETQAPEVLSSDGTWELVGVSLPDSAPARFFRLKISLIP